MGISPFNISSQHAYGASRICRPARRTVLGFGTHGIGCWSRPLECPESPVRLANQGTDRFQVPGPFLWRCKTWCQATTPDISPTIPRWRFHQCDPGTTCPMLTRNTMMPLQPCLQKRQGRMFARTDRILPVEMHEYNSSWPTSVRTGAAELQPAPLAAGCRTRYDGPLGLGTIASLIKRQPTTT